LLPIYLFIVHRLIVGSLLNHFMEALQHWKTWDAITVIESHQLVRDYLLNLWQRSLKVDLFPSLFSPFS